MAEMSHKKDFSHLVLFLEKLDSRSNRESERERERERGGEGKGGRKSKRETERKKERRKAHPLMLIISPHPKFRTIKNPSGLYSLPLTTQVEQKNTCFPRINTNPVVYCPALFIRSGIYIINLIEKRRALIT